MTPMKLSAAGLLCLAIGACTPDPVTPGDAAACDGAAPCDGGSVAVSCAADGECDDGIFCNGAERCAGTCAAGTAPCSEGQACDEGTGECSEAPDCTEPDADGDGRDRIGCGDGDDCDDEDADRFPGNPEVCDPAGHDEDCDPNTISGDPDRDGDGHIDSACWNYFADGTENRGTDCDDTRNTVHASGIESCNGVDEDCDGMIDEGVQNTYYRDQDGDSYGAVEETMLGCGHLDGWTLLPGDCDDDPTSPTASTTYPGAPEGCDGVDANCDGRNPEHCACVSGQVQPCGSDSGECRLGTQTCVAGAWGACEDEVGPSDERCDGLDNDCDDMVDEGVTTTFYRDEDGDGARHPSTTTQACARPPGWLAASAAVDCCDRDNRARPGQSSYFSSRNVCSSWDYNCNGSDDRERPHGGSSGCGVAGFECAPPTTNRWRSAVPGCGSSGSMYYWYGGGGCNSDGARVCDQMWRDETQRCR